MISRAQGLVLGLVTALASLATAQDAPTFDAAAAFGARQSVSGMRLSPDGARVLFIAPGAAQGTIVYTLALTPGAPAIGAFSADGKPWRVTGCNWVSAARIVCRIYAVMRDLRLGPMTMTRIVAVDIDGSNLQMLSKRENAHSRGLQLGGGEVIDWLPGDDGAVLMTRVYLPDDRTGTLLGSAKAGLGVDRVDTRTLASTPVVQPVRNAIGYISDGRGTVRIMATRGVGAGGMDSGVIHYLYREPDSTEWHRLADYDATDRSGFMPAAVDPDLNVAYGFRKLDGRMAVYTVKLDGSLAEALQYARPDVDVEELLTIGRQARVVGATFVTDRREAAYFSADILTLHAMLARALPKSPLLDFIGSSVDENRLLVFAGGDSDPGAYYVFDRQSHRLQTFLVARRELERVPLAAVQAITYPADDGTRIPGYLTLPPGAARARGLPAIVLPHGGPSARDEWGFDWLSQYFAARGFAVLQPNFRGSSGYGDAWFQDNGFRSWRLAIGDVLAGGRWLIREQGADAVRLGIVGWSYGGYAALQSAVVDPGVFKAVVAIAPVTDLAQFKDDHRGWTDYSLVSEFIGDGPHVREGSPAQQATRIQVPVLLFHGTLDSNVLVEQSRRMDGRLKSAGVPHELVIFDDLDHYLEDSAARTEMLRRSDAFLRKAFGR
jgi:dienelactone hydrolase